MAKKEAYDKETSKVMSEGEKLKALVGHEGWAVARQRYNALVLELGNILAIAGDDPQKVFLELSARQLAIQIILNWFRDVEGSAAQHESHKDVFRKIADESYIRRFEDVG